MKIKEPFDKEKVWFISDTHIGHSNIIKFCNRPFASTISMNQKIVELWNNVVEADHDVFHLGDVSLTNTKTTQHILDSLNGRIHLVVGNHEKSVLRPKHIRDKFETINDITEIKVKDKELRNEHAYIVLCHYPMLSWNKSSHGSWHLHGHVHGTIKHPKPNAYDVGVDVNDFRPLSYEQIKTIIKKQNDESI